MAFVAIFPRQALEVRVLLLRTVKAILRRWSNQLSNLAHPGLFGFWAQSNILMDLAKIWNFTKFDTS